MRTTLSKLVCVLVNFLCLNALILSAACSQRTITSNQPAQLPTNVSQPGVQEDGNVVISFAASEYQRGIYEPLIDEFNQQNPEITVRFVPLPQPEPGDLLGDADWNRMLASSADSTLIYGVWSAGSSKSAYFRDLVPMIEMDPAFDTEDFWPGSLDACRDHGGHVLGRVSPY